MKILCEKCHQDISLECNKTIENYTVGRVICPHCHYEQKRYISEADLLLYFGINEIAYILLSLLMIFIFNRIGINAVSIVIIFLVLIAGYFASKELSSRIYEKAYFKADIKNKVFEEDVDTGLIKKIKESVNKMNREYFSWFDFSLCNNH